MPPKANKKSPTSDTNGMFSGMIVFFVDTAVKTRRLQIWEQKLVQMGARVDDDFSRSITHVFAMDWNWFLQRMDLGSLKCFKGKVLNYQWLEDSLKMGERVPEDSYILSADTLGDYGKEDMPENFSEHEDENCSDADDTSPMKKIRACPAEARNVGLVYRDNNSVNASDDQSAHDTASGSSCSLGYLSPEVAISSVDSPHRPDDRSDASVLYSPPDLNRNITEIFGKLIDIYRALGEDRRSFSYYKAIPVIEKFPFKIESADQVKNLPGIGKSLLDHIQEIVRTGKLSKLEHFKKDEKVRTISLFGEVWGIGPATSLKLYEKGHRTLDDLKSEESLTNAQRLGLKYFEDIKSRIPRHEVQQMESLLKKVGEEILPGVLIVCGGSYRRGKASCGDMDIVITHPDGQSHAGFLPQFVKHLKDIDFLREDLVFSIHSLEGSDSGVDTYFGLCTYPGRELRHRIDLKLPSSIGISTGYLGLIAWTGNDVLNRRLRLLAESKGFKLDDTGLFPATQSSSHKRGRSEVSASLKFGTEKEVFDFLGFPWLEPNERNL